MEGSQTPQETKFSVRAPTGELLHGVVRAKGTSRDLVVLCHGSFSNRDTPLLIRLADGLDRSTARFDFSGNGESEGSLQYGNYHGEAGEVGAVVAYLRQEGWHVTALVGHSKAVLGCLLYAGTDPAITHVVNLAGRYHMDHIPEGRFSAQQYEDLQTRGHTVWEARGQRMVLTQAALDERAAMDVGAVVRGLGAHVLTVHGDADNTTPVSDAHAYASAVPHHRLLIVEGANHFFSRDTMWPPVVEAVGSFLPPPHSGPAE